MKIILGLEVVALGRLRATAQGASRRHKTAFQRTEGKPFGVPQHGPHAREPHFPNIVWDCLLAKSFALTQDGTLLGKYFAVTQDEMLASFLQEYY